MGAWANGLQDMTSWIVTTMLLTVVTSFVLGEPRGDEQLLLDGSRTDIIKGLIKISN